MVTKISVLVGGPFDGKGTPVPDTQNEVLIPFAKKDFEPQYRLVDFSSDVPPLRDTTPTFDVIRYTYQPLFTEQHTNVRFYLFDSLRSDLIV